VSPSQVDAAAFASAWLLRKAADLSVSVGTIRAWDRTSLGVAQGVSWTLRRAAAGFGQSIRAVESSSDTRVACYRPSGVLGLRGIFRGTITHSEREFEWRANRHLGRQFTLTEDGAPLAQFNARTEPRPVVASVDDLGRVEPLLILFCCHLTKQVVEVAKLAPMTGMGDAIGG